MYRLGFTLTYTFLNQEQLRFLEPRTSFPQVGVGTEGRHLAIDLGSPSASHLSLNGTTLVFYLFGVSSPLLNFVW